MGWRDHLQTGSETLVAPWTGGRSLRTHTQEWQIAGKLPAEHAWTKFKLEGRKAKVEEGATDPQPDTLRYITRGFLVGDHFVEDGSRVDHDPTKIADSTEPVYLIDPGLDRFVRVAVGRPFENGPLIFCGQEMPLGPEDEVTQAFQTQQENLNHIKGVTPALEAAFRMEVWQRIEAARLRAEEEKRRREEDARREAAERHQRMMQQIGSAVGRRQMATVDFEAAARAALAMADAEYLDHRKSATRGEMVVTFRLNERRFECVCNATTLGIIDSGICLADHHTGRKDDKLLTLETLPSVIREAIQRRKLVVYRRVDNDYTFAGQDDPDAWDRDEDWDD